MDLEFIIISRLSEYTCTTCMNWKSLSGLHYTVESIPTGHKWERITMDIMDVYDHTILLLLLYIIIIILLYQVGVPLVIHPGKRI